jgi:hypothetical protein
MRRNSVKRCGAWANSNEPLTSDGGTLEDWPRRKKTPQVALRG